VLFLAKKSLLDDGGRLGMWLADLWAVRRSDSAAAAGECCNNRHKMVYENKWRKGKAIPFKSQGPYRS